MVWMPRRCRKFLRAKERLPKKKAMLRICDKLSATPKDLRLLGVVAIEDGNDEFYQLSADTFTVMADWYHFAILELTYVKDFKPEVKWIAQQLGISQLEAKMAMERLIRLNLLTSKNSTLVKTQVSLTNHTGLNTSGARKALQKQLISKAMVAVDETPQEDKDITSITMAINPKNLDQAREAIKRFRREILVLLEEGEQSRVYNLGIQLYPLSKKEEDNL